MYFKLKLNRFKRAQALQNRDTIFDQGILDQGMYVKVMREERRVVILQWLAPAPLLKNMQSSTCSRTHNPYLSSKILQTQQNLTI